MIPPALHHKSWPRNHASNIETFLWQRRTTFFVPILRHPNRRRNYVLSRFRAHHNPCSPRLLDPPSPYAENLFFHSPNSTKQHSPNMTPPPYREVSHAQANDIIHRPLQTAMESYKSSKTKYNSPRLRITTLLYKSMWRDEVK